MNLYFQIAWTNPPIANAFPIVVQIHDSSEADVKKHVACACTRRRRCTRICPTIMKVIRLTTLIIGF